FKLIRAGTAQVLSPGPMMVTMGLVSLVFAGFMLYRRRDIKRMFAYSSIEHMGIITLAFGLGGPIASFAGLLHMTMHRLTKSAIFFGVGYVSTLEGRAPMALHLLLVAAAGIYLPGTIVSWFRHVASQLG